MPPTTHPLAFVLLSFVLIVVPGPNVQFLVSRSLMLGRVAGCRGTGAAVPDRLDPQIHQLGRADQGGRLWIRALIRLRWGPN